jgi:hypothetical protein
LRFKKNKIKPTKMTKTYFPFLLFILLLIVLQTFLKEKTQHYTVAKSVIELNTGVSDTSIQKKETTLSEHKKVIKKSSKAGIILLVTGILLLLLGLVIDVPSVLIRPFFILGIVLMTGIMNNPKPNSTVRPPPTYTQDTIKRWMKEDTLTPHELAYQKLKKEQAIWHNATDRAAIKKQKQTEAERKERIKMAQQGKDYTFDHYALTFLWACLGVFSLLFCGLFVYLFFGQGYSFLRKAALCLILGIFSFKKMAKSWRKAQKANSFLSSQKESSS